MNEVRPEDQLMPHPSVREAADFQKGRAASQITMFRVRRCDACGRECPKQFECCSEVCYLKLHPKEIQP